MKKYTSFEKLCWHRSQISPNKWKHPREGYGDPGPCTSRDRLVTIPNLPILQPSTSISCVLASSICWVLNDKKNARFQYVETVPTKKRNWCYDHDLDTSAISCGKVYNTNLPRCLKLWLSIWQPCDTGLRPPFVGLGFMAYPENWKLLSWCFRGSWRPSGLWLHMRSKNLIIIFAQVHGTNVLSQAALANAFFLYKCFMAPRSNNLYSLEPKHIQHK